MIGVKPWLQMQTLEPGEEALNEGHARQANVEEAPVSELYVLA